jgi:signal recognition particle GTPase
MARDYTLDNFRAQLVQVQRAGYADSVGRLVCQSDEDPADVVARDIGILDAMTAEDRADADRIDATARQRIAIAAGTKPADVDALLERFAQVRETMRRLASMTFWQRLKLVFGAKFRRSAPPE